MKNFTPTAKVIADSINGLGNRLVTREVQLHRFVLAEFNTHRAFSRNSASSRAIPYAKMRQKALETPAIPLSWPNEQKGMQGGAELPQTSQITAELHWLDARDKAVETADKLHKIGVHKSVINRLLEPFLPHTIIVSATDWQGFWDQRCHPDAQPEIRVAAEAMKSAYDASKPEHLAWGDFHLPYITDEERAEFPLRGSELGEDYFSAKNLPKISPLLKISAARSARVSYLTHDGKRDIQKDIELYERLAFHVPAHASPLEHPARVSYHNHRGNFSGFAQLRHLVGMY